MDPATLYQQLGHLAATMPSLSGDDWATKECRRWLGQAAVAIELAGNSTDGVLFKTACDSLGSSLHYDSLNRIESILYRALARAELAAPTEAQGAFIPVDEPLTALVAVGKVLASAKVSVFFVDPYAEANLLTEFAALASEGIRVMVLADQAHTKPGLEPVAKAWVQQHGPKRALEVRLAPAKTLHDRAIIVDDREAWTIGQSFNALAKRAPTVLVRVNPETAKLKTEAYRALWEKAEPLI